MVKSHGSNRFIVAMIRLYQILLSYLLVEDQENVLETNLHSWSQLWHWLCCYRSLT